MEFSRGRATAHIAILPLWALCIGAWSFLPAGGLVTRGLGVVFLTTTAIVAICAMAYSTVRHIGLAYSSK